ncbi:hypothetical protein AncyloWKF20_12175 [Ancylobacter sp. WKF20]|uniref:hypothetical protein n=1 Tax=Ancylobacter sp. WKF20 TaxID=3039801 RepID=UPI0024344843|nr:hypothetical protein [Ancylobacter sp. WKF20]WGD28570.1 hypothetical protein AncyloWKF20_12175 [Ancylobacter sp. WKF20]
MKDRLAKLKRIEALQTRLQQRADHELIRLQRGLAEAEANRREVMAVLNDEWLAPIVVSFVSRRLKVIDGEIDQLNAAIEAQKAIALREAMRLKRAERSTGAAREDVRAHEDRLALDEALEASVLRAGASFPPA